MFGKVFFMKRYISVLIVVAVIGLIITGCTQKSGTSNSKDAKDTKDIKEIKDTREAEGLVLDTTVFYRKAENNLSEIVVKKDGKEKIICEGDNYPAKPSISADKKKLAYISPYEFEVIGEVFMYNYLKDTNKAIITHKDIPENLAPKKLSWFDDRYLLVIMGYAYGTVSMGGDLYVYDTVDDKMALLIEAGDEKGEISDVRIEQDAVKLDIVVFNDDFTEYEIEESSYGFKEFLDRIKERIGQ
jgi:outer membrane lipoprotein-sorting protein